jgi:hypothetical protein
MNQEINNENIIQNQQYNALNNIHQNQAVYNQTTVSPVQHIEQTQTNLADPQVVPVQNQTVAEQPVETTAQMQQQPIEETKSEEPKKSKVIILDEDPVKFEVQEIQLETVDLNSQPLPI